MGEESNLESERGSRHQERARTEGVISGIGGAESRGRRAEMQDAHTVLHPFRSADESFIGVYDGYGGKLASEMARQRLHVTFRKALDRGEPPPQALAEAFARTDQAIESKSEMMGTTAAVVYLRGKHCLVGNVGDTRVVLERGGRAVRLSRDHTPDDPEERRRIEHAGGRVTEGVTLEGGVRIPTRVEDVLAVSRALGSKDLGKLIPAEPHLAEFDLQRGDLRAIVASDGLWDTIDDQDALDMIERFHDPKAASAYLLREARKRGSYDNITVIVVDFRQSALR